MKNIIAEGHRGYCARYPENTLLSYEKAMELGVDAVEFDVWLTKDKVPVLMHDGNARRTCGVEVHLRDLTLSQIKQLEPAYREKFGEAFVGKGITVPTLEEMLCLRQDKRPDLMLGVEIKEYTEECCDITVALLKKYKVLEKCFFYAFDAHIITYLRKTYQVRTMGYPDFQMARFEKDSYASYVEIGLNMNLVKSELLPFYQAKGLPIHMYCADTEEEVRFCIDQGAMLITANDPVPLLTVLGRK